MKHLFDFFTGTDSLTVLLSDILTLMTILNYYSWFYRLVTILRCQGKQKVVFKWLNDDDNLVIKSKNVNGYKMK